MEYNVKVSHPAKAKTSCVVLGVFENHQLSKAALKFDNEHNDYLSSIVQRGALSGKVEQHLQLFDVPGANAERVILIGCGQEEDLDEARYRKIMAYAAKVIADCGSKHVQSFLSELEVAERDAAWKVRQAVLAMEQAQYRFDQLKSKKNNTPATLKKLSLNVDKRSQVPVSEQAISEAQAMAAGIALAKDLGNLPGNVCTPSYLADQAKALAKGNAKLKVKVIDEAELEKMGAGSFVSVAKGSTESGKLIIFEYHNGPKKQAPVALVGKGITFDSGGISIKPGAGMDEMKFDMGGAASVFGAVKACVELKLPLNLVALVAAAENMPSGNASKPGDIVTTLSGQTVEILNTDAEGRLVLCDALTYCEQEYKPAVVVDIATLTGACVIALGKHPHGLFSNDQSLADELLAAGQTASDRAWQMPVWDEYQEALKSNFADMANVGGREGGAITAACFLARYTKNMRWAHLDIAGTAWLSGNNKGSTGRPVPLLTQFLMDQAHKNQP